MAPHQEVTKRQATEDSHFRGEGLIFVGGAPRSGTTLVQRILNSHPDVYGGPEFDLIPQVMHMKRQFDDKIRSGRIDLFLSHDDVVCAFSTLIKNLLMTKRDNEGTKYLSEKTPSNILCFGELSELLPNAKFVFVIRDPRAIVSSMLEGGRKLGRNKAAFTSDVVSAVRYVNQCWLAAADAIKANPKVLCVQYEQLVTDADATISRILHALELDGETIELSTSRFDVARDEMSWKAWFMAEDFTKNIHADSIHAWKKKLRHYQRRFIEKAVRPREFTEIYFQSGSRALAPSVMCGLEYGIARMPVAFFDVKRSLKKVLGRIRN